jgi:hypothetical protein
MECHFHDTQPLFDHVFKLNTGSKFLNDHSIDCLENW